VGQAGMMPRVQERMPAFTAMVAKVVVLSVFGPRRHKVLVEMDTLDEYGFMDNTWNTI
jgi:hypothetical protein